jgi:pimeloyl-ACP methyl ester carboxylesterase
VLVGRTSVSNPVDVDQDVSRAAEDLVVAVRRRVDQLVPMGASALLSSKLVPDATLNVYPGASHGIPTTHKDRLNADLLAFWKA